MITVPSAEVAEELWWSSHFLDHIYSCPLFTEKITLPVYVRCDSYALLDFWPGFCSEAMLPFVPNSHLFVIDHSPYYEFILMHSMDDCCNGYPRDVSFFYSNLFFFSDSLFIGSEARE